MLGVRTLPPRTPPFGGAFFLGNAVEQNSRLGVARDDQVFPRPYRTSRCRVNRGVRLCSLHTIGRLGWRNIFSGLWFLCPSIYRAAFHRLLSNDARLPAWTYRP
jgi:hypothetical protein